MTSNVSATSTTGLYGISGNVRVPNSAQQLLNLLYSNGNVDFSLANGNTQVQANAMVSGGGGGTVQLTGNVTGSGTTGSPINTSISASGVTAGTYGTDVLIPQITVGTDGRVTNLTTVGISGGGSYGNSNVAAYLASNTDPTISNLNANAAVQATQINTLTANAATQAVAINTLNANVGAYESWANVTFATQANLLAFETYANATFSTGGGSSYGNSNVAAYLASNTDPTISNLNANAAVQAVALNTLNANVGAFETYANATFLTTATGYGNANVAAYLPIYTGNIQAGNLVVTNQEVTGNIRSTSGYFWGNGAVYGVTRVISGANIIVSPAGGTGEVTISSTGVATGTSTGYYGSFYDTTDQYANVATQSYVWNIGTTSAQNGVSITGGNAITFAYAGVYNIQFSTAIINTGTAQAEANIWIRQNGTDVADSTGQITVPQRKSAGSPGTTIAAWNYVLPVNANDTIQFVWQNSSNDSTVYINTETSATSPTRPGIPGIIATATQVTSVTNAYGNANVATFMANFGSNVITTSGAITGGAGSFTTVNASSGLTASTVQAGTIGNTGATLTGTLSTAAQPNVTSVGTLTSLSVSGATTTGNVVTTNGVFWANGAVFSTGGGGSSSFSGNLAGNVLYDSTNQRIFANAFPLSTPSTTASGTLTSYITTAPSYTGTVLSPPASNQTVGMITSGNLNVLSSYQTASNRTTALTVQFAQVYPNTANNMSTQDRVRASSTFLETNLNGITWGNVVGTANQASTTLSAQGSQINIVGAGQLGAAIGTSSAVAVTPSNGRANVVYASGVFSAITQAAGTAQTASNVSYARLYAGSISGQTGNIIVQNAVGLHTYNGWVSSNVSLVNNSYALLNEDQRTVIQTNGNVTITGNTNLGPYKETVYALGNTSGTTNINYYNGTVQTMTLTGNVTINTNNFLNMPAGGSVTLIMTEDGTGNRVFSSNAKFAGGSVGITQTANAISLVNIFYDGTNYLGSVVADYK